MAVLERLSIFALVLHTGCQVQQPWVDLFDGESLAGFSVTNFGGEGEVYVEDGELVLTPGSPLTGVTYRGVFPQADYEIELRGARAGGTDFFGALTFPAGDNHCTLVLGGWGGTVVGLSSIDGEDAEQGHTSLLVHFVEGQLYDIRLRVTSSHITVWIDDESVINEEYRGHDLSLRAEVELSKPLGLASYGTTGVFTRWRWRPLSEGRE